MGDAVVLSAVGSVGGLIGFVFGFRKLRTLRRIENTPTSVVRSMPMGLVELHGVARLEEPLTGPFTAKPVAFWKVTVEEYRRQGRHSRWVTRHKSSSTDQPFYLEDDTGRVLVLPDGAETHLPIDYREKYSGGSLPLLVETYLGKQKISLGWFGAFKRLRFTEWHIEVGQPFYLHGLAQERPDLRQRQRDRVNEILRDVREDPEAVEALDTNRDGRVDDLEWEQARRSAVVQARSEGVSDRVVVARGSPRDLFLISDRSEHELVRRLRWETIGYIFGGGAAFVAGTAYLVGWFGCLS
jgi:hypothetical protein